VLALVFCDCVLWGSLVLGKSLNRCGPWSSSGLLVALLLVIGPLGMNVKHWVEKMGCICGWVWIVGIFLDGCQIVGMVVVFKGVVRGWILLF